MKRVILNEAGGDLMEAIVRELKSIGLGGYESQAYASLLKHGALTPMQIAKIARIPGPRVYDILRKLESMGFVVKEPRKREPKYSAVTAKDALERYSKEIAADHRSKERLVKEVSAKLAKVVVPAIPTEEVAYILDSGQMVYLITKTIAKKKIWGIGSTNWPPIFKAYPNVLKKIIDLKKRGIELKFLADVTKDNLRFLKKVAKYAEVRHSDEASCYGCYIVDGKEAMLAVPTPGTGSFDTGIWMKHPGMIKVFEDYFILKFKKGIPLEKRARELSKK